MRYKFGHADHLGRRQHAQADLNVTRPEPPELNARG